MKHRHLTEDAGWTMPAIDDILDRGMPADWAALGNEVIRDPFGDVADRVLHICKHHYMYGTTALWRVFINDLRSEAKNARR